MAGGRICNPLGFIEKCTRRRSPFNSGSGHCLLLPWLFLICFPAQFVEWALGLIVPKPSRIQHPCAETLFSLARPRPATDSRDYTSFHCPCQTAHTPLQARPDGGRPHLQSLNAFLLITRRRSPFDSGLGLYSFVSAFLGDFSRARGHCSSLLIVLDSLHSVLLC